MRPTRRVKIGIAAYGDFVQRATPIYGADFTFEGTVHSADGVDFTISGLPGGRIFADTFKGHVTMGFIAFDCPREEVEDIISHCYVAPMIENLSALGEK